MKVYECAACGEDCTASWTIGWRGCECFLCDRCWDHFRLSPRRGSDIEREITIRTASLIQQQRAREIK